MCEITSEGIIFSENDRHEIQKRLKLEIFTHFKIKVSSIFIMSYDEVGYSVDENNSKSFSSKNILQFSINSVNDSKMIDYQLNVEIFFDLGFYDYEYEPNINDSFHVVDLKIISNELKEIPNILNTLYDSLDHIEYE